LLAVDSFHTDRSSYLNTLSTRGSAIADNLRNRRALSLLFLFLFVIYGQTEGRADGV